MGWFKEIWAGAQTMGKMAYDWSGPGLVNRGTQAVRDAIVDAKDDTADVMVTANGDGTTNAIMSGMDVFVGRSDSVVWRPRTVDQMVDGVLAKANGRTLRKLYIEGHGSPGVQWVGEQAITHTDPFNPRLSELSKITDENTVVILGGCNTGEGEDGESLARRLSKLWGAEVRAGETLQRPMGVELEGPVISCYPDPDAEDGTTCERALDESLLSTNWKL